MLRGGKTRRVTIAPCSVIKLDPAILKAKEILALFYAGKDPKHWLGAADPTLQEALDGYIADNKSLGSKSVDDYRSFIETHLASWLASRISTITADMVRESAITRLPRRSLSGRRTARSSAPAMGQPTRR